MEDIVGSLSARIPSSDIKSIDFFERLSAIESCLADVNSISKGVPLAVVSKSMGHSIIHTTINYLDNISK